MMVIRDVSNVLCTSRKLFFSVPVTKGKGVVCFRPPFISDFSPSPYTSLLGVDING